MPVGFGLLGNSSNNLCGALLLPYVGALLLPYVESHYAEGQTLVETPFYNNPPDSLQTDDNGYIFIPDVYGVEPTRLLDSMSANGTLIEDRGIVKVTIFLARNVVNDSAFVFVNVFDNNRNFYSNVGNIVYNDLPTNGTFGTYTFETNFTLPSDAGYSIGFTFIPNESDYSDLTQINFDLSTKAYVISSAGDSYNDFPSIDTIVFNETGEGTVLNSHDGGAELGMILYDLEPSTSTPVCTVSFATYIQIIGVFMSIIVIILLLLILKYVRSNK